MTITRRALLAATAALAMAASLGAAHAADVTLNIGYQPIVEPSRVPQADGTYEKATGAKINWQKFDGGADVIAAIASGSLDIGYVGSSPLAAAARASHLPAWLVVPMPCRASPPASTNSAITTAARACLRTSPTRSSISSRSTTRRTTPSRSSGANG